MLIFLLLFLPLMFKLSTSEKMYLTEAEFSENIYISYVRKNCPYCVKVIDAAKANQIPLLIKDISDPNFLTELKMLGGKQQVPCLIMDHIALYESSSIIAYLKSRKEY